MAILSIPRFLSCHLDENWHNCENDELASISDQFVAQVQVRNIFDFVFTAGLIHLDGRLSNFMFYKSSDGMVIVIGIDWDRCARVGYCVPYVIKEAFDDDERYPRGVTHATKVYHDFFLNMVIDDLTIASSCSSLTTKKLEF